MGKYREFFLNPKGTWLKVTELIRNDKPDTHVHVIEKAAFTEAVELIDETQKAMQSFKDQTEKHGGDYLPAHAIWFNECLKKIKEFKDKGAESDG